MMKVATVGDVYFRLIWCWLTRVYLEEPQLTWRNLGWPGGTEVDMEERPLNEFVAIVVYLSLVAIQPDFCRVSWFSARNVPCPRNTLVGMHLSRSTGV